uniref:SS18 N-terminal domain-containing protein n=1 Tax=Globisporangium ultimum (strain ATCC 200006 / CBS 805.95 / DAOM BR144) TaxID=431595 RepID=K3WSX4_GLOUD
MAAMNQQRAYLPPGAAGARVYGQEESEAKEVNTEEIQAMLDENSALIVEIITLNNQIKHGKGTTQLSEAVP